MKTRHSLRQYKRWLTGFSIIVLILLTATALFNFSVDSVGVFRANKGLKFVAANLLQGHLVAGAIGRNDERELQRLIVDDFQKKRAVVAVGSSRTMPLRGRFIPGADSFFNHSVTGALVEDYVAIVGLYMCRNILPGTVIFGIDPWIFNKNNGLVDAWRTLDSFYRAASATMGKGSREIRTMTAPEQRPHDLRRYTQLINLEYTIQNWYYSRKDKQLYVTPTVDVDDLVREPDGSIHFPYSMRRAYLPNENATPAQAALPERYYRAFEVMTGTGIFEDLIGYLMNHGVRVVLLLPPFYPASYRICEEDPRYRMTLTVESYLRDLARAKNITLVGSFNPARHGLRGEDFFDGVHGHDIVMKKLFEDYR